MTTDALNRPPRADSAAKETGEIFDLGYRSYSGPRLGRWHALRSLAVQSLRAVFGIGRGARAKATPFLLLAFSTVPAIVSTAVAGASGNAVNFITHEAYFASTAWIFALFCAAAAPELLGGDQQHRVLSLYFARALRRTDYVAAKLAALVAGLLILALTPQLVLLLGRAFVNENPWSVLRADSGKLFPILASALLVSLLFASLSLLIASLIKRRFVATAMIVGVLMLTSGIASAMVRVGTGDLRYAILASPMLVGEGLTLWMFDVAARPRSVHGRANLAGAMYAQAAVAVTTLSVLLLALRYRRIRA